MKVFRFSKYFRLKKVGLLHTAIFGLLVLNIGLFIFWFLNQNHVLPKSGPVGGNFSESAQIRNLKTFPEISTFFKTIAQKKGAEYAFALLKIAPIAPNTDMHLLGHVVGDELYKQEGVNGIKICTEDFRNACSHAIVIGLFSDRGDAALPEIANACRQAPGGKGAYTMCFHGLGHGILGATGYDLQKAVDICQKTASGAYNDREAVECVGGTIMEILGGGGHDHDIWAKQRTKYVSVQDPLAPCSTDIIPETDKAQCYNYLTPHLFELAGANLNMPTPQNFKDAFPYCGRLPKSDVVNRESCYGGFGKEFLVLAQQRDIRKINQMSDEELSKVNQWCMLAGDAGGVKSCILTALNSVYWGGENDKAISMRFCNSVLDPANKKSCFGQLIGNVSFYIDDHSYRKDFCNSLANDYKQECTQRLAVQN